MVTFKTRKILPGFGDSPPIEVFFKAEFTLTFIPLYTGLVLIDMFAVGTVFGEVSVCTDVVIGEELFSVDVWV
jgi:hypothetical protein